MINNGYFLLALLLFAFFFSRWCRQATQFLLHGIVYLFVSCSSKMKDKGRLLYQIFKRRLPSADKDGNNKNRARATVWEEFDAEKHAVDAWNLSLTSKVVDSVI